MKTAKWKLAYTALVLTLALPQTLFAQYRSGGGSSGGGTTLNGRMVDSYTREHTRQISNDPAYTQIIVPMLNELETRIPEFALALREHIENIRWVGLPGSSLGENDPFRPTLIQEAGDVMHEIGDKLVAIQRGNIVWFVGQDIDGMNLRDRSDFFIHEVMVHILNNGGLTAQQRDNVIDMTAALSEFAADPNAISAQRLRARFAYLTNNGRQTLVMPIASGASFRQEYAQLHTQLVNACALSDPARRLQISLIEAYVQVESQRFPSIQSAAMSSFYNQTVGNLVADPDTYCPQLRVLFRSPAVNPSGANGGNGGGVEQGGATGNTPAQ